MKIFPLSKQKGYALLMVMSVVGIAALVSASTMQRTYSVANLNQRAKQYQSSMYAAEAATEKVFARMRYDYLTGGDTALSNNLASVYPSMYPLSTENSFWDSYQFSNAQGGNNATYVGMISNKTYQVLDGNYAGLYGWRAIYRIVSNARPTGGIQAAPAGVQLDVAVDTISAFQFIIFYNSQLEFTQCAPLTNSGRVHANGPICLGAPSGSPNTLVFNGTVTTTSTILNSNLGGYSSFSAPVYNGNPQKTTGVPTLQLPIGTNNTPAAVREIINLPQAGDSSSMAEQRYYNKASIVLLVSNLTVNLIIKNPGAVAGTLYPYLYASAGPTVINSSNLNYFLPWVSVTNQFYDYRESKTVMATQIDMNKLKTWVYTNSLTTNKFPSIMYVADFRTGIPGVGLHATRLINGAIIPTNAPSVGAQPAGFTLATINPLYVWGDYNTLNINQGTTNTTKIFPASLVADAFTVLSPSWQDTYNSGTALTSRGAADTTINAAIIAGAVYSTGPSAGQWSGGVHNLSRLLEDWSGDKLTLNTSLVNLYDSVRANTQFQNPGIYYKAPNRNFNFDQNFLNSAKLPPGDPRIKVISRFDWTTVPINTVTFNGP